MASEQFSKGDRVRWNWAGSEAEGTVEDAFTGRVTRTIKGKGVTRKASKENPAYMIKQDNGHKALKSASELSKA